MSQHQCVSAVLSSVTRVNGGVRVLQVYCHKVTGRPLPLPHKQRSQLKQEDLANALGALPKENRLELRSFLLQVCDAEASECITSFFQVILKYCLQTLAEGSLSCLLINCL